MLNSLSLRLFNNQLVGEIPSSINNLVELEFLFLHKNQLSGGIPPGICNQENLNIGLENNQLCPPYPICISDTNTKSQDILHCP